MFKNPLKMRKIPEDNFWVRLLQRCDYSETGIQSAVPRLERMDPVLQRLLIRWDESGEIPDLEVEGFTVEGLVEYGGFEIPAAFLLLDWLRKDPEQAKMALAEPLSKLRISEELQEEVLQSEENDSE